MKETLNLYGEIALLEKTYGTSGMGSLGHGRGELEKDGTSRDKVMRQRGRDPS